VNQPKKIRRIKIQSGTKNLPLPIPKRKSSNQIPERGNAVNMSLASRHKGLLDLKRTLERREEELMTLFPALWIKEKL